MVPSTRALTIGGVVAGVVLIVMVWYSRRTSTAPKIPPRTQRSLDSLSITKPTFDSTQAAGRRAVIHDTVVSVVYRTRVEQVVSHANVAHARADSLAAVARVATDSAATLWHRAYDVRTSEADSLRRALAFSDSAWQYQRDAYTGMRLLYQQDTLRRVAIERVNRELVTAIGKLQQPCRILPFVPCPSRVLTAIGSAAIGAVVVYEVKR